MIKNILIYSYLQIKVCKLKFMNILLDFKRSVNFEFDVIKKICFNFQNKYKVIPKSTGLKSVF
jgi:hypothetical protein